MKRRNFLRAIPGIFALPSICEVLGAFQLQRQSAYLTLSEAWRRMGAWGPRHTGNQSSRCSPEKQISCQ